MVIFFLFLAFISGFPGESFRADLLHRPLRCNVRVSQSEDSKDKKSSQIDARVWKDKQDLLEVNMFTT